MAHELPEGAYLKDISAHFNQRTIPRELLAPSRLEPETWARVVVEEGQLTLRVGKGGPEGVSAEIPAIVPPETEFSLSAAPDPLRFYLEYYHESRLDDASEVAAQLGRRSSARPLRSRA